MVHGPILEVFCFLPLVLVTVSPPFSEKLAVAEWQSINPTATSAAPSDSRAVRLERAKRKGAPGEAGEAEKRERLQQRA